VKNNSDSATKLTVLSIVLGVVATIILAFVGHSHPNIVQDIIAGMAVTILSFQISELWHHRKLSPQMASLERALKDPDFFRIVDETIDLWEVTCEMKRQYPRCLDFYIEKEREIFENTVTELRALSKGDIKIESEARELTANRDFLLKLPERMVCAISYQDGAFWSEEAGKKFLAAHESVISTKRVDVTRIFIMNKSALETQRSVIEHQLALGINCQVVNETDIPAKYREDFVIYDNKYVRYAKLVAETPQTTLKTATLTADHGTVATYREKYDYLSLLAVAAKEYYAKIDSQSNKVA
jgi:hypothetical protein